MAKELTVKQRKLIKGIAAGKTKKQAALDAGYSPASAPQNASEALSKPNVREAFLKAMDAAGITDEKLTSVMQEGLEANRVVAARIVKGRPTDIDDELAEASERTDDFIEVPDHVARHKFLETAVKIKGVEAAKQVTVRDQSLEDLLNLDDGGSAPEAEDAG